VPTQYDVIVIGGGPGGYTAAIRSGQLGKKVLCVEKERLGGVCLNWGCMPSKALLHIGEIMAATKDLTTMGVIYGEPKINLAALSQWKSKMVDDLVNGVATLLKANRVDFSNGSAEIIDPKNVRVKKADGRAETYGVANIIIATGSEPVPLPGAPRDGRQVLNSDDAVTLTDIPRSILIIGAGVIGLEFATIYRRLGSRVTVLELMDRALGDTDLEISTMLVKIMQKQGVEIHLKTKAMTIDVRDEKVGVRFQGEINDSRDFDKVLVAVGRRPRAGGLELDRLGVKTERGFVQVDERRQTTVPGIYAIGDVTGPPLLAHKAMKEGVVAAEVIAGMPSAYDPVAMPNLVYTDPQLATVGLSEEQAKTQGYDTQVGKFRLAALGRARTIGLNEGMVKIVSDKATDLVLGMGIVSPTAESMIAEGVMAIEMGATVEDIGLMIHPHPTFSESIMEAAEMMHGKAIHVASLAVKPEPARAK